MIWKEKIETEKLNQTILTTKNKVLIGGCEEIKEVEEDMYNSWVNSGDNTEKFCTDGTFVLSHNNTANPSVENSPQKNSPRKDFLKKNSEEEVYFKRNEEKIKKIEITPIGFRKNSKSEEEKIIEPKLIFEENGKKRLDEIKKIYVKKKTTSSSNYLNVVKSKKNRHLSNDVKKISGKFTPDFKSKNFKKIKKSLDKKKGNKKGIFDKLKKNYHYKTMNSLKKQNLNYKQPSIERKKDLKFTKIKKKYTKKKLKSSRENVNPIDCDSVKSHRNIKKKKPYKSINIKERNERNVKNYKFEKFDGRFKSFLENTFCNENSLLKSDPTAMTDFKFYKEKSKSFKNNI